MRHCIALVRLVGPLLLVQSCGGEDGEIGENGEIGGGYYCCWCRGEDVENSKRLAGLLLLGV